MKQLSIMIIIITALFTAGCANNQAASDQASSESAKPEGSGIEGNFPPGSAFAKLEVGMSVGQVHGVLGDPTDSKTYQTGKAWIPFYFGSDVARFEEYYKGIGTITYTGAGIGGVHWKLYRAIYDESEDGFAN